MRVAYLGPEGTYSHEALMGAGGAGAELLPRPTIHETIMAVHDGEAGRALVPIENSLEGAVNATLDTLVGEAADVFIVGEVVHEVHHCLIAPAGVALEDVETVVSIPHASAQCARFLRERLPDATLVAANSTAEAVRTVVEQGGPRAALGNHLSAQLYGGEVLGDGVEDTEGNATRFVWLAPAGLRVSGTGAWKTSIVFWGAGDDTPGWLVRCLSEFAFRGVNLTMIASRPRKLGLGHYVFFADLEGRDRDPAVAAAVEAVRGQTERLRVLGSYPAA
ncbi:MAG TPA: prephenate dehydratase [Solirubrobacteraceae bacterium]|nr:prephenate dehydratase [Solirubrobacteraceae bacterium]